MGNILIVIYLAFAQTLYDMIWNGSGKTSILNYNSTKNYVTSSPGFYFGNSFGEAIASFINILISDGHKSIINKTT